MYKVLLFTSRRHLCKGSINVSRQNTLPEEQFHTKTRFNNEVKRSAEMA